VFRPISRLKPPGFAGPRLADPMHVLIVDDDRSTRYLIARTLTKRFACEVTEAGDGSHALDALARTRYDLAFLDVQMPEMDGLEALRTVRSTPALESLPVVMLTGERDETVIREILELGVLEYLAKPLNMARLNGRVRRILRAILWRREGAPPEPGWLGRALCDGGSPLLLVDGRTPFRRCFIDTLGARRSVIEAETGVGGLREMAAARPSAVFVGTDLGVLSEPLLLRKIRSTPSLASLPVVAIVDDEEEGDGRMVHYDGTLTRTLSAETLLRRFADLIRLGSLPDWDAPELPPGFRATVLLLCEQVFGMALASDVGLCDLPFVAPIERVTVSGAVRLSPGAPVGVEVMCDMPTARRAATNLFGIDGRMVDDDNAGPAIVKVFEMLCARLSAVYQDRGTPSADARLSRTSHWTLPPVDHPGVTLCFQAPNTDHAFWIVLSPVGG
jgi:CheY-like chemotaxis protein